MLKLRSFQLFWVVGQAHVDRKGKKTEDRTAGPVFCPKGTDLSALGIAQGIPQPNGNRNFGVIFPRPEGPEYRSAINRKMEGAKPVPVRRPWPLPQARRAGQSVAWGAVPRFAEQAPGPNPTPTHPGEGQHS